MAQLHNRVQSEEPADDADARMGFLDHLDELRTRLIKSCIALGAGMVFAFFFVDRSRISSWTPLSASFRPTPR